MQRPDIVFTHKDYSKQATGIIHIAIAVGSKEKVDALTATLHKDGYAVASAPRTTGDGYYESVVLDPEGNIIEITV
jgi:lactoylglutathione lyase